MSFFFSESSCFLLRKRPKWRIFWFLLQKKRLRTLKLLSYERTMCEQYDIHLSSLASVMVSVLTRVFLGSGWGAVWQEEEELPLVSRLKERGEVGDRDRDRDRAGVCRPPLLIGCGVWYRKWDELLSPSARKPAERDYSHDTTKTMNHDKRNNIVER